METLYIEAASLECSEERREISGKIVPLGTGEIGHTNLGAYTFAANSIEIADPTKIKLLSQHDLKKPIGRMTAAETRTDGIYATFKLSRSSGGNDALIMAQEGLVTGLSIGAEILASKPSKDGHTVVSSARLKEVSLVTVPAFASSEILEIAAEEVTPVEENPTTESETAVEDTTSAVEATPAVEAAPVEAARPTVTAAMYYTNPRIEITKRNYLENTLKANLFGDDESRQWLRAADNDQTTGAGFIPTPQSTQLLNFLSNADRPMIDSISRGTMPEFGKTFELPKITEVPLVDQIDENGAVTESQLEASYITVTKKSFKGRAITTLELLTNSTPAFLDELLVQMEFAYAKDTEEHVTLAIQGAGTLNATAQANSADGLLKYVSSAAAAVYAASLGFGRNMVVTPEQWANIMSYNDGGRPIYIAANPQNAGGALSPTSLQGNVAGLDLRVSRYMQGSGGVGTADYSMAVINPAAYTWYEGARQQLRTNINSDGTVDILLFGQGALATKLAAGANWFNFT
jgi:HK97 family phage prohead protease|uniref:HK97 family phage prohead protease n=1 Tax=Flavobacterium sp. TaxID=239 RepID=UPI0040483C9C